MNRSNILWSLLGLNAVLFMVMLIWLGHLQLPTADDLIYLKWVKELGIWESTMLLRQEWNTRWAAILINQTYLSVIPKPYLGLAFQTTNLALGFVAFHPITKFLHPELAFLKRVIISVSLLISLFLLSLGLSDSWFWMCSQPTYLWASLISFWMIASVFRTNLNPALLPVLILAHVFIGGASEIIAISVLLIELSLLLLINRVPLLNKKALFIGLVSLIGSFLFSITGEGIETRYAHLSPPGIIDGSIISVKSYLNVLVYGIGSKMAIIGSILVVLLAIRCLHSNRPFYDWKIPFGIADGVLVCSMIITAFTLGDIGPNRALTHISVMLLVLVVLAIPLIRIPIVTDQILNNMSIVLCLILAGYLSFTLVYELPKEALYSKALQERHISVESQINIGMSEIKLEPLPDSKFLYRAEISEDPNSENNKQLATIFGDDLQFVLIVSD